MEGGGGRIGVRETDRCGLRRLHLTVEESDGGRVRPMPGKATSD